jgi:hypothetical protein
MKTGMIDVFVSGLARFRTTQGKIAMMAGGKLTINRLMKYAMSDNIILSEKAIDNLAKNKAAHLQAIALAEPFLSSDVCHGANAFLRSEQEDQYMEFNYYQYNGVYPLRQRAQKLLEAIAANSTAEIGSLIQSLLKNAQPTEKSCVHKGC